MSHNIPFDAVKLTPPATAYCFPPGVISVEPLCHVCGQPGRYTTPHPSDHRQEQHHCQDHPPAFVRAWQAHALAVMQRGARKRLAALASRCDG